MSTKYTEDQNRAIFEGNSNILVSAGAGSGKTAVLTERIFKKLVNGTKLEELVVLTFTKAAASEMKERIELKIKDNLKNYPFLQEELDYIDLANITTFDGYCNSLVKKYHYLLNLDDNFKIGDSSLFKIKKVEIINTIFLNKIKNKDENFLELLDTYSKTDANDLKDFFLKMSNNFQYIQDKDAWETIDWACLRPRKQKLLARAQFNLENLIVSFFYKFLCLFLVQVFDDQDVVDRVAHVPLCFIPD